MDAYLDKADDGKTTSLLDGMITNRTDLTTRFYKEHKTRLIEPSQDPGEILDELGYTQ
jgi:hypothetical protein